MKKAGKILFGIYLMVLVWILLFKFSVNFSELNYLYGSQSRRISFMPTGPSPVNPYIDWTEFFSNILIFIPFGGLLGITDKKSSFAKKVTYIFLFSVIIEVSQFLLGLGITDLVDVITNVCGGIIGLSVYELLRKFISEDKLDSILIVLGYLLLLGSMIIILLLFFII